MQAIPNVMIGRTENANTRQVLPNGTFAIVEPAQDTTNKIKTQTTPFSDREKQQPMKTKQEKKEKQANKKAETRKLERHKWDQLV